MIRLVIICFALILGGCYSFQGISIDPNVTTFAVRNIQVTADNAPPTVGLDFSERLRDKIRSDTRLTQNGDEPDIEFTGSVIGFNVVPVAPKPGEVVAQNRLELRIQLTLVNAKNEKKSWPNGRTFSHFAEFSNDVDLLTVQDRLIRQIGDQLLEDIFNAAFNDW
jgi:Lipopolysaccharide-assembly